MSCKNELNFPEYFNLQLNVVAQASLISLSAAQVMPPTAQLNGLPQLNCPLHSLTINVSYSMSEK